MQPFKLLIDGKPVDTADRLEVVNPATEEVFATCPRADEALLNDAVGAGRRAFPAWSAVGIAERRERLLAAAAAVEARADELARLLTAEQGKPLDKAIEETFGSIFIMRALASLDLPTRIAHQDEAGRFIEQRRPLGVVATITPWNFPISLLMVKVPPALLAGNCVVIKPAPTTPLTTLRIVEIMAPYFPAGVINVITDNNDLGGTLTGHPDIAKISFTGSTATGKKVMASAAPLLKRVTLELGGNDAAIVLDDADVRQTARNLFDGAMINSGQVCLAIKRAYVPRRMHSAICSELAVLADQAIVDDGAKQGTEFGPLQNRMQYEKVRAMIAEAGRSSELLGAGETDGPGYFIRPTIVNNPGDDSRIVREEQFGPVLPVLAYDDIDEAVTRANDSELGLGGTVWSSDPEQALAVAQRMQTGMVWVNSHMNINPFVPMGGAKQSGLGSELGLAGLEEYTQRHVIYMPA